MADQVRADFIEKLIFNSYFSCVFQYENFKKTNGKVSIKINCDRKSVLSDICDGNIMHVD